MARNRKDTLIPDYLFDILETAFLKIGFKYSDNDIIEVNEFSVDNDENNDFSNAYENYNISIEALFPARDYTEKVVKDSTLLNYLRLYFNINSKAADRREEDARVLMTLSISSPVCLNY